MLQIGFVAFGACGDEEVGRGYRHSARPGLARKLVRRTPDVIVNSEFVQQALEIP